MRAQKRHAMFYGTLCILYLQYTQEAGKTQILDYV